jgi:hypothetical protein
MGHRLARWVPRTAAMHGLHRTMLGSSQDDHALARPPLDWEAHAHPRLSARLALERQGVMDRTART